MNTNITTQVRLGNLYLELFRLKMELEMQFDLTCAYFDSCRKANDNVTRQFWRQMHSASVQRFRELREATKAALKTCEEYLNGKYEIFAL